MPRRHPAKHPADRADVTRLRVTDAPESNLSAKDGFALCANGRTSPSPVPRGLGRRDLLTGVGVCALAAIAASTRIHAEGAQAPPAVVLPEALSLREIAPGIFVHRGQHALYAEANAGDIANCGFVIGDDAVAVIDTGGTFHIGKKLAAAIAARTDKPVRYVINTHMHPDHVFGNAAFEAASPAFVAHHKMARGLAARAERYLAINRELAGEEALEGTRIVLPTDPVAATTTLDLGNRRLVLEPRRTAHTDNDMTVLDETTGILFAGDIVFSGHVPSLDGSILGWRAVLDDIAAEKPAFIVPGHGAWRMTASDALGPMRAYLDTVITGVREAIAKGLPLSRAVETVGRELGDDWELFFHYHGRNVSAAYAELEWE